MRRRTLLAVAVIVALTLASCGGGGGTRRGVMAKEDEDRLLAAIPEAIREDCVAESSGDPFEGDEPVKAIADHPGATAGFFCSWEPASGGAGSVSLTYLLFPDRSTMYEDYWKGWVPDVRFGSDCTTEKPSEFVLLLDGKRAGRVFCTAAGFQPEITWTDDDTLVTTHAMQIPYPDIGAADLYTWWRDRQQGKVVLRVPPSRSQS